MIRHGHRTCAGAGPHTDTSGYLQRHGLCPKDHHASDLLWLRALDNTRRRPPSEFNAAPQPDPHLSTAIRSPRSISAIEHDPQFGLAWITRAIILGQLMDKLFAEEVTLAPRGCGLRTR